MKIDWAKPILIWKRKAYYVGRTFAVYTPHVVASNPIGGHCDLYSVDDFGRDKNDVQVVTNAPEPKKVYSGLWTNLWMADDGRIYTSYQPYASREDALAQTSTGRRIACIRLPDFTEGEGLE